MSCLFNSLGRLLDIPTNTVRQTICDYLQANKPILDGMSTQDVLAMERADYITHMRNSSVWGGAIEIQAATNIWNTRVIVQNRRDARNPRPIEFVPIQSEPSTTLTVYWTGGHYEPVSKS
jgi:hypothetical protein